MTILLYENYKKNTLVRKSFYHKIKTGLNIIEVKTSCHLEVYYKVDRLLSDDSILCDNSKQMVSIIKKPSM